MISVMTRRLLFPGLVIAIALSSSAVAQRGSAPSGSMAPPASLLTGGTHMSPGAATITSPSFGVRQNGGSFGGQHNRNGVPLRGTVPPRRDHGGRNHNNRHVPFYGGYYPYYGYGYTYAEPVYVEDRSSLSGAGTFETAATVEEEDDRVAPTVFENRRPSDLYYHPRAGESSVLDEATSRYGEHYTERRESAAEQTNGGVVSANGNENNDITTLLIFRDGLQREVTNYAIMGQYIYVFVGDRRKIPLSEIDVDATIKANEARGSEFKIPSSASSS